MPDIITLKALCEELKIDPRKAREKLRAAVGDANRTINRTSQPLSVKASIGDYCCKERRGQ